MEVTSKLLKSTSNKGKFSYVAYFLYKIISLYGESMFLPFAIWTIGVIIMFSILRCYFGICSGNDITDCSNLDKLLDSMASYFQIPRGMTRAYIIERIISTPILGATFIAARRRFE